MEMDQKLHMDLLRDALLSIDPASLGYDEWLAAAMAAKDEGLPYEVFDQWCSRDGRPGKYNPENNLKKWKGFNGSGTTGASITKMAMDRGWKPSGSKSRQNTLTPLTFSEDMELPVTPYGQVFKDPTEPLFDDPVRQTVEFIKAVFRPEDKINIVTSTFEDEGKWKPSSRGFTYSYDHTLRSIENGTLLADYNPQAGVWVRANPMDGFGVENKNTAAFRHVLVESDNMSIEKQIDAFRLLELPITAMTLSAGKSVHALVKVDAKDGREYKDRVRKIFAACEDQGLRIDQGNRNSARLTRLPGVMRNGKEQSLLALNIGFSSYEEWERDHIIDDLPDFESLEDYFDDPPELPPETIHKVLRKGEKLVLTGPSKAGKSFALIQLAAALAKADLWLGRFRCERQIVAYINLELTRENAANRMLDTWKKLYGSDRDGMSNLLVWHLRGRNISAKAMVDTLIRRHKSMANPPQFYIIDPIYKINAGDENAAKDMNELLREFDRLLTETGANLAYAHHHAKGTQFGKRALDRGSGSGVIGRDADAAIDLDFLYVPQSIKLSRAKAKRDDSWMDAYGLRVEMTLRNFKNRPPFNVWFRYPIHEYDSDEAFQSLRGESEKDNFAKAEDGKQKKKEETNERIKQAILNALCDSDSVRIGEIAEETGLSRNRIKSFLEGNDDFEKDKDGFIRSCQYPENDSDT